MLPFINIVGRNVSFGEQEHEYASSSCLASAGSSKLPTISESSFNSLISGKTNRIRQRQNLKHNNIQFPLWNERNNIEDSSSIINTANTKRSYDKLPKTTSKAIQPTEMHLEYRLEENRHTYTLPISNKDRSKAQMLPSRPSTHQITLPPDFDLDPSELSSLKPHSKVHRKRKKEKKKASSPLELECIDGSLHTKTGCRQMVMRDRYELPNLSLDVVHNNPSSPSKQTSPTPIILPRHSLEPEAISDSQSSQKTSPSWPASPPLAPIMYKVVITKAPEETPRQNSQEVLRSPPSKKPDLDIRKTNSRPYIAHKLNLYAHNQISTYAKKRKELVEKRKREATQRKIIRPKFVRSKTQIPKTNKTVEEKKPQTPPPKRQEKSPSPTLQEKSPSPDLDYTKLAPHIEEYYPIEMEVFSPEGDEEEDMDRMEVENVVDIYSNLSVSPAPSVHRPKTPKLLKVDKQFLSSLVDPDTLSKTFKKLDTNGDGHLSFPEVKRALPPELNQNQIAYIKKMYDLACENTFFGLEEFIGVTCFCKMVSRSPISHSFKTLQPNQVDYLLRKYTELFADVDRKAKGVIPASSIREILSSAMNSRCNSATVGKILKEMHKSPEDDINGVEFLVYIPYLASQLSS